jgi:hypothetical protein
VQLEVLRELRLEAAPRLGRALHLSAASGLVKVGEQFYVVADDELHLGVFPATGSNPGTLIRMFDGELPDAPEERKQHKPDLEALVLLPSVPGCAHGALLALGSGSKKRRRRGVLLTLEARGVNAASARVIDLSDWFAGITAEVESLNVEGAVVYAERLVLMHRGNKSDAKNCLITMSLQPVLEAMARGDEVGQVPILACEHYDLGTIEGVPLCFTDGAILEDGSLVFAAVAEDTADSYHDGPCGGAAVGIIGSTGKLRALHSLERPYKIEGIHAERYGSRVKLWLVTDADDASVPAMLLTGLLPG